MTEAKWIRESRKRMEEYDLLRVDMVRKRVPASYVNDVSRAYLRERKKLRIDWQRGL